MPGEEPPAGGHERHREFGLTGELGVQGTAGDELGRTVGGDVVKLHRDDGPFVGMARREASGRDPQQVELLAQLASGEARRTGVIRPLIRELPMVGRGGAPVSGHQPHRDAGWCNGRSAEDHGRRPRCLWPFIAPVPLPWHRRIQADGWIVPAEEEDARGSASLLGRVGEMAAEEPGQLRHERVCRPWYPTIWREVRPRPGKQLDGAAQSVDHANSGGSVTVAPPRDDEHGAGDPLVTRSERPVPPVATVALLPQPPHDPWWCSLDPLPPALVEHLVPLS